MCVLPPLGVHFVRYNQWPEIEDATHEELQRITAEEQAYGGVRDPKSLAMHYEEGDISFWVDTSVRQDSIGESHRFCRTPLEWQRWRFESLQKGVAAADTAAAPCLFVVDLNGHFVSAMAFRWQSNTDFGGVQHDPVQLLGVSCSDAHLRLVLAFLDQALT
eukprot:CAMPEP_0206625814 /NCGR_PEP_ID=MMETSP0325_2-20121206/64953_1 /ASSEMBLY_ACC=CAM_ASM_000347 /TAXON_ID=2866 /ORGANISM="Crypthecodinium cohnii, Strain Seligo" /LENGTH=160 /DNA_ID=CAMNT_0054150057 /DNA_START=242 /DNA_END=724 /DNA_ORIENTATION=-